MAKILLVDDSDIIRSQIVAGLAPFGHSVIEAVDGADGIAKARATSGIDMVIADLNMPKMDGIAMCREIRGIAAYVSVPIIMLTTETSPTLRAAGKAIGIRSWAVKPVNPASLNEAIGLTLKASA